MNRALVIAALYAFLLGQAAAVTNEFEIVLSSYGVLSTVAGRGQIQDKGVNGWEPAMEGGSALDAELSRPHMAMADRAGNIYIADKDAHAIRKVTPGGLIHTVAGTGVAGFNGDGPAIACQLNSPNGLYTFPDGTTYILDMDNARIRKLDTAGQLTTVVHDADGIYIGRGLWVGPQQDLIYFASFSTNLLTGTVRKWTPSGGLTNYVTGLTEPGTIAVSPIDGLLYVTDRGAHRVYKIETGGAKTAVAGNGTTSGGGDGQPALSTGLNEVRAICFGPNGGYYLGTHDGSQVWYVDTSGVIHLLIDGDKSSSTHAGDGESIRTPGKKISEPRGLSIAPNGDLLITENDYGYVRVVDSVVRILAIENAGSGGVMLNWTSVPGTSNVVEGRHTLTTGSWDQIQYTSSAVLELTTSFSETPTNSPSPGKFYRVIRKP